MIAPIYRVKAKYAVGDLVRYYQQPDSLGMIIECKDGGGPGEFATYKILWSKSPAPTSSRGASIHAEWTNRLLMPAE